MGVILRWQIFMGGLSDFSSNQMVKVTLWVLVTTGTLKGSSGQIPILRRCFMVYRVKIQCSVNVNAVMFTKNKQKNTHFFQVYSINFDGSDKTEVLSEAVHNAQNVAVDWINFKLYLVEERVERIEACDYDGGNRVTLIAENLVTPHGLALDPTVG